MIQPIANIIILINFTTTGADVKLLLVSDCLSLTLFGYMLISLALLICMTGLFILLLFVFPEVLHGL